MGLSGMEDGQLSVCNRGHTRSDEEWPAPEALSLSALQHRLGTQEIRWILSMASSSLQTSFSLSDLERLRCTRLNDNVYELYRPASGPISMQIVFFHGFQTIGCEDAFIRTWMTRDGSACWLNTWLVESIPQAHILSVTYDSSTRTSDREGRQDMYVIGENLAYNLVEVVGVGQDCPVVLVGHCVGGLVLKELCLKASQMMHDDGLGSPHRKFLDNLRGMFFYSTAQLGSPLPLKGNLIQGGPLLTYFKRLSTDSARITDEFRKLRRRYNWQTYGVSEANETRTVTLRLFFDREILPGPDSAAASEYQLVVGEGSSRNDLDKFCVISDVDHFTICNPKDQYSNSFVYLIHLLKKIREEEDESNRDLERRLQLDSNWICFDERMGHVIRLLDLRNLEPKRLSIVGMDGVGKSTLVKQILVRIQRQFDFACFLEFENVPQKQQWTDFEKLFAENLYRGSGKKVFLRAEAPWSLLRRKKVLVVVDDVEVENQIRPLLNFDWCGEGSRLIITTCKKSLISQVMAFIEFDVPPLYEEDAQELFGAQMDSSLLRNIPRELVSQIVNECDGLPLALQLVGRYLSRKSDELIWIGVLEMLRIRTTKALGGRGENEIWKWFKVIFFDLHPPEQKIFLDLATFDVYGLERNQYDLNILKAAWRTGLGFDGSTLNTAIENLRDMCLLRIRHSSWPRNSVRVQTTMDGEFSSHVYIHKLLRNIGKWLSRLLNEEVDLQHGRGLWELEEIKDVLNVTKGEVTQGDKRLEVLSMVLEPNDSSRKDIKLSSISRFEALRLLRMSNFNMIGGSDEFILPQSLAMLHMIDCSGPQPRWFNWWQPEYWPIREENVECLCRLSVLLLDNCNSIRLPENIHKLQNLRILQIHDSTKGTVMKLPATFGFLPSLEHLSLSAQVGKLPDSLLALSSLKIMKLSGCSILKEWPIAIPARVNPSSHLTCLTSLELSNLPALAHLPDTFGGLRSLETLSLTRCSALEGLPEGFSALQQLRQLYIRGCERLERLCESFGRLPRLRKLILEELPALQMLSDNIGHLPSLEYLDIVKCSSLEKLPESFIDLHPLLQLSILDCDSLESLWQDVPGHCGLSREPRRLLSLRIKNCPRLRGLPESIGQFSALEVMVLENHLEKVELNNRRELECLPESLVPSLRIRLPECIGELKSLRTLILQQSQLDAWQSFQESLGELMRLETLSLTGFQWLVRLPESLGQLTSLRHLSIRDCGNLQHLPESLGQLTSLRRLWIMDCGNLQHLPESLGQLTSLRRLWITDCGNLQHLPESLGQLMSLRELRIRDCGNLQHLPESLGQLTSLRRLWIRDCGNLQHLPESLGQLTALQRSEIRDCGNLQHLPESLGQLTSLQELEIRFCGNLQHLPESLGQLTSLQQLEIRHCGNLEHLPESLGQLTSLQKLEIRHCGNLQHLPESLGQLTSLQKLEIRHCGNLQHLPESLGQLTSLQKLEIKHCGNLQHLPESLGQLTSLRDLWIRDCENLQHLPESLGQLTSLPKLEIRHCGNLQQLPESLGQLTSLRDLWIRDCENLQHLPESLGQLTSLRELGIMHCGNLQHLPESLGQLTSLKGLYIQDCGNLQHLPESLGQLTSLQDLYIQDCRNLQHLPESLGQLTSLQELWIRDCGNLQHLPESLGQLTSLQELGITRLWKPAALAELIWSAHIITTFVDKGLWKHAALAGVIRSAHVIAKLGDKGLWKPAALAGVIRSAHVVAMLVDNGLWKPAALAGVIRSANVVARIGDNALWKPAALAGSLGKLTSLLELEIRDCGNLPHLPESLGVRLRHL